VAHGNDEISKAAGVEALPWTDFDPTQCTNTRTSQFGGSARETDARRWARPRRCSANTTAVESRELGSDRRRARRGAAAHGGVSHVGRRACLAAGSCLEASCRLRMNARPKSCSAARALCATQRRQRFAATCGPPSAKGSTWCSSSRWVSRQRCPRSSRVRAPALVARENHTPHLRRHGAPALVHALRLRSRRWPLMRRFGTPALARV
jgi:hypothetical protein